jgi:uncharacterized membrane protein
MQQHNKPLYKEFAVLLGLSASLIGLACVPNPSQAVKIIRLLLGMPYLLFFPGHCLVRVCFPARADLENKPRLALAFGFSLALTPSLMLFLDWTPWRITLWSILFGILLMDLLLMILALLRQESLPMETHLDLSDEMHFLKNWGQLDLGLKRLYFALAFLVIAFGIVAATIIAAPAPAERITEFYLLGDGGRAQGYPWRVSAGELLTLTLGVHNLEGKTMLYAVEAWDQTGMIGRLYPLILEDGALSEFPFSLTPTELGDAVTIDILLFRYGEPEPYRCTRLITEVVKEKMP